jgi:caffeoyl-CoA O-methyltransferase
MEYYKRCLALIRKGGIVILDNMLWGGSVINPNDDDSKSLRKTGDYIQKDVRVFNILVPIRDGLMLCIKNEK